METLLDIKGIGEKTFQCFNKLGINTPLDLLYYFPRDYECFEKPKRIVDVKIGKVESIKVMITSKPSIFTKGHLNIVSVTVTDGIRSMKASWFNLPYIKNYLTLDRKVILRGRIAETRTGLSISQARIYDLEKYDAIADTLTPIYSLTKGISNATIVKALKELLKEKKEIIDYLPADIRKNRELAELNFSLEHIHFPKDYNEMLISRKRLVYDELFLFSLGLLYNKKTENRKGIEELKNVDTKVLDKVIKNLPFTLTKGQEQALIDILGDFKNVKLMNRLVEGDVGSGKTIIAILSMLYVAFGGYQSCMMAPTEVLAMQHFENVKNLLEENNLPFKVCIITGKTTKKERKAIVEGLTSGDISIVIGTHAVFSDDIVYKNLAFIITDEQHRFGVNQRKALEDKGDKVNVLVMSATPIPRTLSMLLYADLDISIIKDKPANRLPIKNAVIKDYDREKAYKLMKKEIESGRQCYVVCPLVESQDTDNEGTFATMQNVIDYTKKLKSYFGTKINISYLHGKMKAKEKDEILARFRDGEIDILCSTTVIEVGIDCPNATIMLIEDAPRFGLATLHQLRGRVGRGKYQSYAIYVDTMESDSSKKRLDTLIDSNDGFYIAEQDLKLRGPGDIFGVKQSGSMDFKIADMYSDYGTFKDASIDAKDILKDDPRLLKVEHKNLKDKLDLYIKGGLVI